MLDLIPGLGRFNNSGGTIDLVMWKYICGCSFFIYCFHEPVLNIFNKLALAICDTNQLIIRLFYYINPILMIITAIIVAKLLKKFMPQVYVILAGGR